MKPYFPAILLAGLLLAFGCLGSPSVPAGANNTSLPAAGNQTANLTGVQLAGNWMAMHAMTYRFDAVPGSLKLESTQTLPSGCDEYVYSFQSAHAGYGNRSGRMMAAMLTAHNTTLHFCSGNLTWANTDGVYDEIRQTDICMMLSAIVEVCGTDNQTYSHPCFAKAKGIAIAHVGACAGENPDPRMRTPFAKACLKAGGQMLFEYLMNGSEDEVCMVEGGEACNAAEYAAGQCAFLNSNQTQIANPASEFCIQQGGTLEIVSEPDGQVGFCVLPDGTRAEEWSYFRSGGNLSAPIACTLEYAPVCGSDGQTYGNKCQAHAAGAAVVHSGDCESKPRPAGQEGEFCGGIAGFPCAEGLVCRLDGGYPDAGGKCVRSG